MQHCTQGGGAGRREDAGGVQVTGADDNGIEALGSHQVRGHRVSDESGRNLLKDQLKRRQAAPLVVGTRFGAERVLQFPSLVQVADHPKRCAVPAQ